MNVLHKNYQKKLFPYAYNILGSVDDALDVIQDVIINFLESDHENIKNESAYLIKSVINKSINLKKRNQRITGDLSWLPDPIATESSDHLVNSKDILSYTMLVMLEYLKPRERAVFILKSAFDYSHQEIAEVFSISVDNSKQLLRRAKKALNEHGADFKIKSNSNHALLSQYIDIIKSGDVRKLELILSEDIETRAGGGVRADKAIEFTRGINAVSHLLINSFERYLKKFTLELKEVNHSLAVIFYSRSKLVACKIFEIDPETNKIISITFVAGKKKLKGMHTEKTTWY
ncbi:sigma-70 family RNA polymerase sigma factor [Desertivirga brevis]|uniref:sigma-70 family RNA polymerase sigma factor n=1 Tax=Desertivirga brevis TaxID=2810310 RepID=UPI001A96CFDB|nr:sigma-70 family RNA polymerase sigma factor [Pedobacter sp. SYSU D00873]